ncbi:MAG: hypothetical protein IT423_08535 [Pirellulaceae bacterium]|nr:hypothetical protein [Pirellulaceae bacterium]
MKDSSRLKVCYSLASPENRHFTGPFARFAQMLMTPPYDSIATSAEWQLGTTAIESDFAAVLVSTISSDGNLRTFRFILQRHSDSPYEGCWLTEAVQVLEQVQVSGVRKPATVEELSVD